MERENAWESYSEEQLKELKELCEEYKTFLDEGKTERECVTWSVKYAKEHGFKNY